MYWERTFDRIDFAADFPARQALRDEIDRQRRLELAFAGERWFDLVRYARDETEEEDQRLHAVTALDIIEEKRGNRDENYLLFANHRKSSIITT